MSQRIRFFSRILAILAVGGGSTLLLLSLLHGQLGRPAVQHVDLLAQARVHTMTNPTLTGLMLALTWLGSIAIFAPALAAVALWLAYRERNREAALLGGGMSAAFVLNETLKLHFHRARPQLPWSIGDEHTFSFPSGHSLFAVVLYGMLAYCAMQRTGPRRSSLWIVLPALLMPLGIGLSRIYVGMHYPTDVLAGWLAGALWLGTILMIDRIRQTRFASRVTRSKETPIHPVASCNGPGDPL